MSYAFTSLKNLYVSEVSADLAQHASGQHDVITEEDIAGLPEPVQKHFRYCGYMDKKKMTNVEVSWKDVYLKMSPEKKWTRIACYQYNAVPAPTRIVYMTTNILGILPFEGRDKYQDGHGNMRIKLLKLFTVADVKGKEMDASALVTVLAEALFLPTYALQKYIQWETVDATAARATLTFQDTSVSGTFRFNDQGAMVRFDTNDRYYTGKDGTYKNIKWSAVVGNYIEKHGIRFPGTLQAIWHLDTGDYPYFKGNITNLAFDIQKPGIS